MKFKSGLEDFVKNERLVIQEREEVIDHSFLKKLEELGVKGFDLDVKPSPHHHLSGKNK